MISRGWASSLLLLLKLLLVVLLLLRDGAKPNERVSNACVNFFIVWVKFVINSTLFCGESELCCNFVLFWVILMAFNLVNFQLSLLKE